MARAKTKQKKKEETERKVPFKNYLILIFVCLLTIAAFASGSVIYKKYEKRKLEVSVLKGVVPELSVDTLDNYVVENDRFFLYIGSTGDAASYTVERDLLDYMKTKDIKNDLVMMNAKNIPDFNKFASDFNSKFSQYNYAKLNAYPAFIIMRDGKIVNLVQKKDDARLSINDIDKLLEEYAL